MVLVEVEMVVVLAQMVAMLLLILEVVEVA